MSEVYYQSVNYLEPQISLFQASKWEMIDEWGCCSPRNIGGFLLVLIHELVQKFHVFCFSLYLTVETMLLQDLAVETKWPMFHKSDFPVVRFGECSLFFFQLVQATLSCPHAAISSHNLRDKSTSRLMKETESHRLNLLKEIQASQKSAYKTEGIEQL